jgi:LacI family transcriptional regulator
VRKNENMPDHTKTNTIGVIVHELDSYFITSALKGIEETVTRWNYKLIVTHSQECREKEVANARLLFDSRVDGVIASLCAEPGNPGHFTAFTNENIPLVFFDRVAEAGDPERIVIDNAGCGYLATEHLIRQGCRRIAIVTPSPETNVYAERYKGYRAALEKYDIPFSGELLLSGVHSKEAGNDAAEQIMRLKPLPDGLFIINDLAAAMCMDSLKKAGIRVPEDIAMVGFNNDPIGRLVTPALTTINYPGYEMGKKAAEQILDHLTGRLPLVRNKTTIIPSGLIIRKSSLKTTPAIA